MAAFAKVLEERRAELKLSLKDLGNLTGLTPQYLHDLEKGRRDPSEKSIEKFATALGVRLGYLRAVAGLIDPVLVDHLKKNPERHEEIVRAALGA